MKFRAVAPNEPNLFFGGILAKNKNVVDSGSGVGLEFRVDSNSVVKFDWWERLKMRDYGIADLWKVNCILSEDL